jgi:DeoR/GlpR family transcriptional regulator of sugar metabolism
MVTLQRQHRIVKYIQERKEATVLELSEHFGISVATVRRDLQRLDEEGQVQRVHGGALSAGRAAPEPSVLQRMADNAADKRAIGRAAADLVMDGETVFVGSGTTTVEVARSLALRHNLTVVTNALNIANVFAGNPDVTLILLGGLLRHSELSLIGHLTEQSMKELHTDKVLMGMRAVSAHYGLSNDYLPETLTDRAIMGLASEIIVVADHTKLGKVSTVWVAPISSIHTVVTDSGACSEQLDLFRQAGVHVVVAPGLTMLRPRRRRGRRSDCAPSQPETDRERPSERRRALFTGHRVSGAGPRPDV